MYNVYRVIIDYTTLTEHSETVKIIAENAEQAKQLALSTISMRYGPESGKTKLEKNFVVGLINERTY